MKDEIEDVVCVCQRGGTLGGMQICIWSDEGKSEGAKGLGKG